MSTPTVASRTVVALLAEIVDDAGLFPPAELDMPDAVDAHLAARAGEFRWMLGRFVCPAGRLEVLHRHIPRGADPFRLSVIAPTEWDASSFGSVDDDRWRVEALEARLPDADVSKWAGELSAAASTHGANRAWLENPWADFPDDAWQAATSAIAARDGVGLKVRCGGADSSAIPPPATLASIMVACRDAGIAFKATAGLHHPFRHGGHHGFLNLAVAAALARVASLNDVDVAEILSDEDVDAFQVDDDGVSWHELHADVPAISTSRRDLFFGFGSCSFREPVDDLVALRIVQAPS
jgi:hypothetical protein